MPDDIPDLSPGGRIGELSHAAQAAVQISSMRREAADRRDQEALRAADEQVAQLDRVRSEWDRLRGASEAAVHAANDTRFEATYTSRVAAASRQQADGAVLAYDDALQAPARRVSDREMRRLEREVELTARRAEADAHVADRAIRANAKASTRLDAALTAQREFEAANGIQSSGLDQSPPTAEPERPVTVSAGQLLLPDTAVADRLTGAASAPRREASAEFAAGTELFATDDDLSTPVAEDDLAAGRGHAAIGRGADDLANADAATAAAGAARVAFTVQPGLTTAVSTSPPSPVAQHKRGRTR